MLGVEYRFDKSDFLEVLDSTATGSFICDLELDELYISEKWKRRLGLEHISPKEAISTFSMIAHPDDLEHVNREYASVFENKLPKAKSEFRVKTKDSGYIWVLAQIKVIYNQEGKPQKYYGTHIDITHHKQIEESHKKNEERYKKMLYSMDDMFCVLNVIFDEDNIAKSFRLIEVNPEFEKLLGNYDINYLGKSAEFVKSVFGESCYEALAKVALTAEPERVICESKISDHTYLMNIISVDKPEDRKVATLISDITHDIKIKNMEKTIKMQEELISNVSHELKTPLNVIFSTNQLLQMYLRNDSFKNYIEKMYKATNIIRQNCYRFTKLINNIVDLSKVDAGFFKLHLKNENIVDIIENIVQSVAEYIKEKDLTIIFDTDIEEAIIACDTEKIERLVLNLISNAIKFTNPGGSIFVNVFSKDDFIEVTVRDTGIGIDEQQLELIFRRFHQVDKSLSRNAEGSGIGLSLVKSIVEAHGGHISVESKMNMGSVFRFRIPNRIIEEPYETVKILKTNNRVEMIDIEFSDIYN